MKQKRRLIGAVFLSALLAVTGFAMASNVNSKENYLSDIQMENLEALADVELESGGKFIVSFISPTHWKCTEGGTFKCPIK